MLSYDLSNKFAVVSDTQACFTSHGAVFNATTKSLSETGRNFALKGLSKMGLPDAFFHTCLDLSPSIRLHGDLYSSPLYLIGGNFFSCSVRRSTSLFVMSLPSQESIQAMLFCQS